MKNVTTKLAAGIIAATGMTSSLAYELPYPVTQTYTMTQGNNTGSHTGFGAYAYDFGIPVGSNVAASEAGTVRLVKKDSSTSGCDSKYANDANYVVIDHADGKSTLYMHLGKDTVTVAPGSTVSKGQVIGKVGLSGWVCGAHLHFQVQSRTSCSSTLPWYCQSSVVTLAPRLKSPSNGQTVSRTNVNFQWEAVPRATSYRIVMSQRADFLGYNDTTRTCDATCFTVVTSGTSYIKTMNNPNFTYYVKTIAADANGFRSPWSNSWFKTSSY